MTVCTYVRCCARVRRLVVSASTDAIKVTVVGSASIDLVSYSPRIPVVGMLLHCAAEARSCGAVRSLV